MEPVVALLRGVNVGRANRLSMSDLRAVLTGLGGQDVTTYLQSGNAVLRADPQGLAARVEAGLAERLGLAVRVVVRTGPQLARTVEANPFPHKTAEPTLLHVAFVEPPPSADHVEALGTRHGDDELAAGDGVVYLSYAAGTRTSPLSRVVPRLGGVVTTRNWSTVTRLAELACAT